ncbi:MAG: hypothetical protein AB7F61_06165 [Desulfobulbus sp.]
MNAMKKVPKNLKSVLTRFGPLWCVVFFYRGYLKGQWKEAQSNVLAPKDAVPALTVGKPRKTIGISFRFVTKPRPVKER